MTSLTIPHPQKPPESPHPSPENLECLLVARLLAAEVSQEVSLAGLPEEYRLQEEAPPEALLAEQLEGVLREQRAQVASAPHVLEACAKVNWSSGYAQHIELYPKCLYAEYLKRVTLLEGYLWFRLQVYMGK